MRYFLPRELLFGLPHVQLEDLAELFFSTGKKTAMTISSDKMKTRYENRSNNLGFEEGHGWFFNPKRSCTHCTLNLLLTIPLVFSYLFHCLYDWCDRHNNICNRALCI